MTYQGHVHDGRIVLDDSVALPEGARVTVNVTESASPDVESTDEEQATLYERMKPLIGIAKGLPPDAAQNLDHYLYGHPKQEDS